MSKALNALVAAAAGFAAGVLLAPKSGKETREEIRSKARDTKGRIDEKTGETMDVLKEGATRAEIEARDMAKSIRKSAGTVAAEANFLGHEAKERAARVAENSKQAAKKQ